MNKPELLFQNALGGTVHSYELTGGLTTYERYLGCFMGSCRFYESMNDAIKGVDYRIP